MTETLAKLSQIEQRIATTSSVEEAKTIAAQAEALRKYAKSIGLKLRDQNKCALIKILAERRGGELLTKVERARNRKLGEDGIRSMLERIDLARVVAHRWQVLATIPETEVRKREAKCSDADRELTSAELYRERAREQRFADHAVARKDAAEVARRLVTDQNCGVYLDSFQTVAERLKPASVDFIFTDPPYHDATLDIYTDLGTVAARVLKDGASLITYTSHHRLPDVIDMLQAGGLTFFWPIAIVHAGQEAKARMTEYGIVVHWKPLLWFVKGRFRSRDDMQFVNDLVDTRREKDWHPWQ